MTEFTRSYNAFAPQSRLTPAVLWPFRPGRPPLFFSWSELRDPRVRRVFPFARRLEVHVGETPVKVLLPAWVGDYVVADDRSAAEPGAK
jgi:hypothetical protein